MTITSARPAAPADPGVELPSDSRWRAALEVRAVPAAPAVLLVLAIVFMRPNIEGEQFSLLAFGLTVLAATIAIVRRGSNPIPVGSVSRAMTVVGSLIVAACISGIVKSALIEPFTAVEIAAQDLVVNVGAVVAAIIVFQDPENRRQIGRGFVLLVGLFCASYAVTAVLWTGLGLGFGEFTTVDVGKFGAQPVYFPFTTTNETQLVFGLELPRFTGFGREPGWMAMYCVASYFLAGAVGLRSRWLKALFLVGLLGTVSTAGFGVFVVVWAWDRTLRPRGGITLANYGRQVFGLLATPVALWLATDAPVLGLSAKKTQNGQSLDDRESATAAGFRALLERPWGGGHGATSNPGINLIADIAVDGLVFVVLIVAALVVPLLMQKRLGKGACVVLTVFLTLLLSQPPFSSAWAFALVALALGCDELTAEQRERPPLRARRRRPPGPRRAPLVTAAHGRAPTDQTARPHNHDPHAGSPILGGGPRS